MAQEREKDVGADNAKVPDTAIQGEKAGKRNQDTEAEGAMPLPAGESGPTGADPREAQLREAATSPHKTDRSS